MLFRAWLVGVLLYSVISCLWAIKAHGAAAPQQTLVIVPGALQGKVDSARLRSEAMYRFGNIPEFAPDAQTRLLTKELVYDKLATLRRPFETSESEQTVALLKASQRLQREALKEFSALHYKRNDAVPLRHHYIRLASGVVSGDFTALQQMLFGFDTLPDSFDVATKNAVTVEHAKRLASAFKSNRTVPHTELDIDQRFEGDASCILEIDGRPSEKSEGEIVVAGTEFDVNEVCYDGRWKRARSKTTPFQSRALVTLEEKQKLRFADIGISQLGWQALSARNISSVLSLEQLPSGEVALRLETRTSARSVVLPEVMLLPRLALFGTGNSRKDDNHFGVYAENRAANGTMRENGVQNLSRPEGTSVAAGLYLRSEWLSYELSGAQVSARNGVEGSQGKHVWVAPRILLSPQFRLPATTEAYVGPRLGIGYFYITHDGVLGASDEDKILATGGLQLHIPFAKVYEAGVALDADVPVLRRKELFWVSSLRTGMMF